MVTLARFDKSPGPSNLLWFDGEYTGLEPSHDLILEIGFIATDFELNPLGSYTNFIKHEDDTIRTLMQQNHHWDTRTEEMEQFIEGCSTGLPILEADLALSGIAKKITGNQPGILAGNSLFTDRKFISSYLPNFASLLHYRMLDVSSFKLYIQATQGIEFRKNLKHRAFDDIQESIEEFRAISELLEK